MCEVIFEQQLIGAEQGESVLDALTRHGHEVPAGCRSGVCQSCVMVADEGEVPAKAQTGLSAAQISLNYFLSCQCVPQQKMAVRRLASAALQVDAEVVDKTMLNNQVLLLRLKADLAYQAGQYVNLWRDHTLGRSYSIASVPGQDDYLEFHIKQVENGRFSRWLSESVKPGDRLGVQGPMGKCIYAAKAEQPLLLAAISTGLAPIYGIARQALSSGHQPPIHLLVGARNRTGFYLVEELQALAQQYDNLTVHFICQDAAPAFALQDDIYAYYKQQFADLKNWQVYLCGAESFVKKMRKQSFLAGAAMSDISADSFLAFNN